MRIVVHDYAGHAFPIQLSRALAARGNEVLHLYASSIETPRGQLKRLADDSSKLEIRGIAIPGFSKHSFVKRWWQEKRYGRLLVDSVRMFAPEVVISGQAPLHPQALLQKHCQLRGVRFVHWWQDVYSEAIKKILSKRNGLLGAVIGGYYNHVESNIIAKADHIVSITDGFLPLSDRWNVPRSKVSVVPNWAPIQDIPVTEKSNAWARKYDLDTSFNFIYSGTLGMKHNPELLLQLALELRQDHSVKLIVISEGVGHDWLTIKKDEYRLDNLVLMPFQPFECVPQVLGSADVLLGLLEQEASTFSVPSKVLSYLCAARPVLLSIAPDNLAARIIADNQAGLTVPSGDATAFVSAAEMLKKAPELRARFARNGRAYAEGHFDLHGLTNRFETILAG